jgi:hypothetical protein
MINTSFVMAATSKVFPPPPPTLVFLQSPRCREQGLLGRGSGRRGGAYSRRRDLERATSDYYSFLFRRVGEVLQGHHFIIFGKSCGSRPAINVTAPNNESNQPPQRTTPVQTQARRDNSNKDEPFAFDSREFLRKKLIGKQVKFRIDYAVASIGREFGQVYLGGGGGLYSC